MASLEVLILSGPRQDQRFDLEGPSIYFGRHEDNALTVTGRYVSRQHGEMLFANDNWSIINQSDNGTEVNGKRIGKKPLRLKNQDIISVGGESLFQITIPLTQPLTSEHSIGQSIAEESASENPSARRKKIWIGISVYMALVLIFFIYLGTITRTSKQAIESPLELTTTQIATAIAKPPTVAVLDARTGEMSLRQANELFLRQEISIDGPYRAYRAYQMALAHSGRTYFKQGLDQRRFDTLQETLTQTVHHRYTEAYERLRSREYRAAERQFRRLNDYYPDSTSSVFRNIEAQRKFILAKIRKYKR